MVEFGDAPDELMEVDEASVSTDRTANTISFCVKNFQLNIQIHFYSDSRSSTVEDESESIE